MRLVFGRAWTGRGADREAFLMQPGVGFERRLPLRRQEEQVGLVSRPQAGISRDGAGAQGLGRGECSARVERQDAQGVGAQVAAKAAVELVHLVAPQVGGVDLPVHLGLHADVELRRDEADPVRDGVPVGLPGGVEVRDRAVVVVQPATAQPEFADGTLALGLGHVADGIDHDRVGAGDGGQRVEMQRLAGAGVVVRVPRLAVTLDPQRLPTPLLSQRDPEQPICLDADAVLDAGKVGRLDRGRGHEAGRRAVPVHRDGGHGTDKPR